MCNFNETCHQIHWDKIPIKHSTQFRINWNAQTDQSIVYFVPWYGGYTFTETICKFSLITPDYHNILRWPFVAISINPICIFCTIFFAGVFFIFGVYLVCKNSKSHKPFTMSAFNPFHSPFFDQHSNAIFNDLILIEFTYKIMQKSLH